MTTEATDRRTILVVPCYNEEHRFRTDRFVDFLTSQHEVDLLLVNDGSTDGTVDVLQRVVKASGGRATLLDLKVNGGKAEAVRSGMREAIRQGCEFVGFWDADLATPLPVALDFLGVLRSRPDIEWVFGARVKLLGRQIQRRAIRHYLGRVFATAASLSLGVGVYDTQCGAKLFRATPELERLIELPFLTRWIFDVELLARMSRSRRGGPETQLEDVVFEYPLFDWQDVAGSKVRGRDFAKAAVELFRIHTRYMLG
jgi:glycosyltransferase involved in cell wall biosynthesis